MGKTLQSLRRSTFLAVAVAAALYPITTAAAVAGKVFEYLRGDPADMGRAVFGSNTLTNLIPTIYNSLDVVSRELVGFIPAVSSDMTHERAAVGQTVRSPVAPASTASDITPAVTPPNDGDQTIGSVSMTISKSRRVPIRWNGEEKLGLDNNGAPFNVIFRDQVSQAMRTLVNEVEADTAALHISASRAYGTAGTTPFASTLGDPAQMRKILVDNGAPTTDLQLVIDTSAGANMRTLAQLTKANEAADTNLLRRGVLLDIHGFAIRESAQVKQAVTVGTASGATTNNAGYAVGTTTFTLASAGTGTLIAGDVITFAGDTNKYVVVSGDTDVSNGGTLTIAAPGIKVAMSAATKAITVVAAAARNMAFSRNALCLATRVPALPPQGDSAADRQIVTDPVSGLSFEIAMYPQYRQMQYEVSLAWGVAAPKPEHLAILLG